MIEYFFKKYGGDITKDTIKIVYEMFDSIKKHLPYNDFEGIMNKYLNLEVIKKENQIKRLEVDMNLKNIKKSQSNLINDTVIDKRNNNKLIDYLRKLSDEELMKLNQLVDLGSEFKVVTDIKYNEMKDNRRSKSHKSISLSGDYNLNQTL